MFDDYFRAWKERLLAPVARLLGPRVAPNVLTVSAAAAGAACVVTAWQGRHGIALALWWLNRVLDGLDGTQARVHGRQSAFGAYLDIVLDFGVYAGVPIALAVHDGTSTTLTAALVLVAAFYVNAASWMYLAALLEQRQQGAASRGELTTVTMPPGLVAGTETVVAYSLFLLWPAALAPLFTAFAALVLAGVVLRLRWASRHLD
ncbi:MAG: CDP-alcohol phosphatidyltransferase family protein [Vicinamibacterales bacterium]